MYGARRQRRLAKREVKIREKELKRKQARDAVLAEERRKKSEHDIKMLSDMFSSPPKCV